MKYSIFNKYLKIVFIIILLFLLVISIDLLLFISSQKSIVLYLHPMLINYAIALGLFSCTIIFIDLVNLLISKKWRKLLLILSSIILISIAYSICFKIAVKTSMQKAQKEIIQLFTNNSHLLDTQIEENAKERYKKLKTNFNINKIKLISYSPLKNNYLFLARSEKDRPLHINLSRSYNKTFVYIFLPPNEEINRKIEQVNK